MQTTRVFIDTNIWFSTLYKEGTCSKLLRQLNKSSYEIVISELVLEEIIRTIQKKTPSILPFVIEYLDTTKVIVAKNLEKKAISQYHHLADIKDAPILATAVEYECSYFVTGNLKDFKIDQIGKKHTLIVVSPADFLKDFQKIRDINKKEVPLYEKKA